MGGLNNRNLFLIVLKSWKSKIKARTDLVSGESSLPGLQMAFFCPCPHTGQSREKGRERSLIYSYKGTNSSPEGSMT